MFISSDQALSDTSGNDQEIPRHFMVISRPCNHPETPPREGYIRGQYESVEFIREIPREKTPQKSASTTNLLAQSNPRNRSGSTLGREAMLRNASKNHPQPNGSSSHEDLTSKSEDNLSSGDTRARGHTISFDKSRGSEAKGESMDIPREDDENEQNPIEWIMITRSDPGGSVPRFMIERGTPGGIVADASKFLNWACAKDLEDLFADEDEDGGHKGSHDHDKDLHNYQTNGHLAGIEDDSTSTAKQSPQVQAREPEAATSEGGLYGMAMGASAMVGGFIASHTPAMISDHLPTFNQEEAQAPEASQESSSRRASVSSFGSASSAGTFASALEGNEDTKDNDVSSQKSTESTVVLKAAAKQDKELEKLEDKKRKLDGKLSKAREKEMNKKSEDTAKEEEAIRKAEEKHQKEVRKQEEKYRKEVEKLERKKAREAEKAEEKKRKAEEKDEKLRLSRELEEAKAELDVLRKEKEILRAQVGDLQAENTALAARVGRLGLQGEEVLRDVRAEVGRRGRMRASSLKGLSRTASFRSSGSGEREKEKENIPLHA